MINIRRHLFSFKKLSIVAIAATFTYVALDWLPRTPHKLQPDRRLFSVDRHEADGLSKTTKKPISRNIEDDFADDQAFEPEANEVEAQSFQSFVQAHRMLKEEETVLPVVLSTELPEYDETEEQQEVTKVRPKKRTSPPEPTTLPEPEVDILEFISSEAQLVRLNNFRKEFSQDQQKLTFGVFEPDAQAVFASNGTLVSILEKHSGSWFYMVLRENDPRRFHRDRTKSKNVLIDTHYVICNGSFLLHLAVLIDRGVYYWVGNVAEEDLQRIRSTCGLAANAALGSSSEYILQFPLAVDKQMIVPVKLSKKYSLPGLRVYVPGDLPLYRWHLPSSRFMECDYENLVWPFRKVYPTFIDDRNNSDVYEALTQLRAFMLRQRVPAVLYAGSLLGWYRQCSYISYSKDVDFMIEPDLLADEEFFRELHTNSGFLVWKRYGFPHEGLEFNLYTSDDRVKIDLFSLDQNEFGNETHTSYYWPSKDKKTKERILKLSWACYPNFTLSSLCSVDLLGALSYAPCDPLQPITSEYGIEWFEPREGYVSSNFKYQRAFTAEEEARIAYVYGYKKCERPTILWGCEEPPKSTTTTEEPPPLTTKKLNRAKKKGKGKKGRRRPKVDARN